MSGVTVVEDLSVRGPVELDHRNIIPAGRADGLDRSVHGLDSQRVTSREISVECSRVRSKRSNLDAQHWIARQHIDETASVAVPYGKETSSVHAKGLCNVCNQRVHETKIIHV